MSKIFILTLYELKMRLQDRKTLLILAVTPLALALVIGFGTASLRERGSFIERFSIALVNQDHSIETRTVLNYLENDDTLDEIFDLKRCDYEEAIEQLQADAVSAVIVIPPHFGAELAYGRSTALEIIPNHRRPLQCTVVDAVLQSLAGLVTAAYSGINTVYYHLTEFGVTRESLNAELNQAVLAFTLQSLGRTQVLRTVTLSPLNHLTPLQYYAVSLGLIFLLLGGMITLRPAHNGGAEMARRLLARGASLLELVLARFIAMSVYLALPFIILFALLAIFEEGFRQGDPLSLLVVSTAAVASAAALFILISYLVSHATAANLVALFVIVFMSLAGGSIIPLVYLPPWLQALHLFSFNRWAAQGLYHAFFISGPAGAVYGSVAVLTAFTAVSLLFSVLLLKFRLR